MQGFGHGDMAGDEPIAFVGVGRVPEREPILQDTMQSLQVYFKPRTS